MTHINVISTNSCILIIDNGICIDVMAVGWFQFGRKEMMKKILIFLTIFSLLIPLHSVFSASNTQENIVILTADQVTSAVDIEAAIINATAGGNRFGTVILDGSKGPFVL